MGTIRQGDVALVSVRSIPKDAVEQPVKGTGPLELVTVGAWQQWATYVSSDGLYGLWDYGGASWVGEL